MRIETFERRGLRISVPVPESYADCVELIRSDEYRESGKMISVGGIIRNLLNPYKNTILVWFRLAQYDKGILSPLLRHIYFKKSTKRLIDMPPATKVGYGLYIGHGQCMVVNKGCVIGNNCNLSHMISLGANNDQFAYVGDNTYIGPGVCSVEGVNIGHNVTIGTSALVSKDIPDNATAVGVPAHAINFDNPARFINNRYPC